MGNYWDKLLFEEFQKDYYLKLRAFFFFFYLKETVYPDMHNIFNAFKYTDYKDVKAVIIGQDPYHRPGQAHGLCFSVREGMSKPPSLINILKELYDDLGIKAKEGGSLIPWAEQGVLLINAVLTVRRGEPNSHKNKGWEIFTDKVMELLNEREDPMVFILWGKDAEAKGKLIKNSHHLILKGAHPSPLSAYNGFFGGRYFSKANEFLEKTGRMIDWSL